MAEPLRRVVRIQDPRRAALSRAVLLTRRGAGPHRGVARRLQPPPPALRARHGRAYPLRPRVAALPGRRRGCRRPLAPLALRARSARRRPHYAATQHRPPTLTTGGPMNGVRPLIIDDFHHIAPEVQRELIRQLKPLIDENAAVIFAAVPHRAADVVAAESEMRSEE